MFRSPCRRAAALVLWCTLVSSAAANTVTDWDAIAIGYTAMPAPSGQREMAILHAAMFDAVNSIEHRYHPYQFQLPAPAGASPEAAAEAAAATVLKALHPEKTAEIDARLSRGLAGIAEGAGKTDGLALGTAVAQQLLQQRSNDGFAAADAYRPRTQPGVYVPTPITVGSSLPNMVAFALSTPSQFRPGPPVALTSQEWATDYNEVKDYGAKNSARRTALQTETARFWLMTGPPAYHPIGRQVVEARQMSLIDSARFMTMFAIALTDAYIAGFDAKYHYEFWRPITAIRNGDIDANPATERDPGWQPIDNTPMHPEYPCAHCFESGAAAEVIRCTLGTDEVGALSLTSATAPGVTHHWTNLQAFENEVAQARIWAGFHYRFSTRAGNELGHKVAHHVCETTLHAVQ
jgi:hypothetical protein